MINGAKLIVVSGQHEEEQISALERYLLRQRGVVIAPSKDSFARNALKNYVDGEVGIATDPGFAIYLALQRLAFQDEIIPALRRGVHVITNLDFFPSRLLKSQNDEKERFAQKLKYARDFYFPDLAFQLLSHPENDTCGNEVVRLVRQYQLARQIYGLHDSKEVNIERIKYELDRRR